MRPVTSSLASLNLANVSWLSTGWGSLNNLLDNVSNVSLGLVKVITQTNELLFEKIALNGNVLHLKMYFKQNYGHLTFYDFASHALSSLILDNCRKWQAPHLAILSWARTLRQKLFHVVRHFLLCLCKHSASWGLDIVGLSAGAVHIAIHSLATHCCAHLAAVLLMRLDIYLYLGKSVKNYLQWWPAKRLPAWMGWD